MFLLVFTCLWIFVLENKMNLDEIINLFVSISEHYDTNLVRGTTFVGTEHNDVRRGV